MARIMREDNRSTYIIRTALGNYAVTLWRLKNDINGNPRWEANVMVMNGNDYWFTAVYRFAGHYYNEQDEARWIVERYEKDKEA